MTDRLSRPRFKRVVASHRSVVMAFEDASEVRVIGPFRQRHLPRRSVTGVLLVAAGLRLQRGTCPVERVPPLPVHRSFRRQESHT